MRKLLEINRINYSEKANFGDVCNFLLHEFHQRKIVRELDNNDRKVANLSFKFRVFSCFMMFKIDYTLLYKDILEFSTKDRRKDILEWMNCIFVTLKPFAEHELKSLPI